MAGVESSTLRITAEEALLLSRMQLLRDEDRWLESLLWLADMLSAFSIFLS
jgi:hypothetical protein